MPFSFHANTLAFGGELDEGSKRKLLPSQASVTLPQEGGFGESTVSNYYEEGISFYRAESRVYGNSFENTLFKTYANVTIYGLDIAGILKADVLSATITSINRRQGEWPTESEVSFDANIVGLVIGGVPYDVELDTAPFTKHRTFGEFANSVTQMSAAQAQQTAAAYNWSFQAMQTQTPNVYQIPAAYANGIRATIVRDIKPALPGYIAVPRKGFTLEVPNLGLVHLGEVLLTAGRRTINMLRIQPGMTLADLEIEPAPIDAAAPAPGALAIAAMEPESSDYTITVCNATGNGTDYGRP
ncbi:MAG TPA: hypothetical protein VFV49_10900 [Thermoanaerobaculia bacterium]|nr:hypothetical protein [Thermoanaerobaculia bacterium]